MTSATLPPELERFATEAVAQGRYRDRDALIEAGVSLLQRLEAERGQVIESVLAAQAEGDRDGYLTAEDVVARVEARIARRSTAPA
jgi:putative addiction module CopG family antidote